MRTSLALLLVSVACCAQPTVKVVGFSVIDAAIPFDDIKHVPFWIGKGGTRIVLAVTGGDANLIDLDDRKSKLTMTDAQGTDLLTPKDGKKKRFGRGPFEMSNAVTPDGKTLIIPVEAPRSPAKGSAVSIKGALQVVVAAGTKIHTAETRLEEGDVALPGLSFKISSAKMGKDWNDKPVFKVEVAMKGAAAKDFAGLRFLDAGGEAIKATQRESMNGMGSRTIGYEVGDKPIESCTIELKTWDGRRTIAVPVDLTVTSPL